MGNERNKRFKIFREKLGFTQDALATKLNLSKSYISDIENNRRTVTDKLIKKVTSEFNISPEWLYTGEGGMEVSLSNKNVPENVPFNVPFEQKKGTFNLGDFVDMLVNETQKRTPIRYAKRLSENDITFEYDLGYSNLKDAFNDNETLKKAMHKMGAPDFMKEKFPLFNGTFSDYLNGCISDCEDYFGENYITEYKKKEHRIFVINQIFHPNTEHLRRVLSKLIMYLNQYGDMFKEGIGKTS